MSTAVATLPTNCPTPEQANRAAWLESRRTGIGGSDAAAICGLSKWKSPLDVYLDKIGELETQETEDMRRGNALEPYVLQRYANETGYILTKPTEMFRHAELPFLLANPDALVIGERGVDAKTAARRDGWGEPGTADAPMDYLCQCQHYMVVLKMDRWDLATLFGTGFEFAIYPVEADAEFQDMLIEAECEFWKRVIDRNPPDPITISDVKRRWPKSIGKIVNATPDIEAICRKMASDKLKLKNIELDIEVAELAVKKHIGESDTLLSASGNVLATWKSNRVSLKFDQQRFERECPELYYKYLSEKPGNRPLLLKQKELQ